MHEAVLISFFPRAIHLGGQSFAFPFVSSAIYECNFLHRREEVERKGVGKLLGASKHGYGSFFPSIFYDTFITKRLC